MNLDEYLKINNCNVIEGYSTQVPDQVRLLKQISENNNIKNILEIGFNAGHSSCLFLESNKIVMYYLLILVYMIILKLELNIYEKNLIQEIIY